MIIWFRIHVCSLSTPSFKTLRLCQKCLSQAFTMGFHQTTGDVTVVSQS